MAVALPAGLNPGLCECGCGEQTKLAPRTTRSCGWVKGEPLRFIRGHNARSETPDYLVDSGTGCWVSQRYIRQDGYSHVKRNNTTVLAHRWHWEQANGPIPEGLELDHLCRNRACVNPAHLEPVPRHENVRRGRRTKLTYEMVEEIRRSTDNTRTLAQRYDVTTKTIRNVVTGHYWRVA